MAVTSLGYVLLSSPELARWRRFAEDLLGLMPVEGPFDGALHYRMDDRPPRLVITPSAEPSAVVGFEVPDAAAFERVVDAVEAHGAKVVHGNDEERAERSVAGLARFDDPAGVTLEVFHGRALAVERFQSPKQAAFVTGAQGMGHVIVTTDDPDASYAFYTGALGLVPRNTMKVPDGTLWFLGCNPRQHSLGILPISGPGRLVHLMFEMPTLDDVGHAIDRLDDSGFPMQQTLGRHSNDHMVSFYVASPDRHAVEVGCAGRQIHVEEPVFEIVAGALWGHKMLQPPDGP